MEAWVQLHGMQQLLGATMKWEKMQEQILPLTLKETDLADMVISDSCTLELCNS